MAGYGSTATTSGLCPPAQEMMNSLGDQIVSKRKVNIADVVGLEGKNTYELYHGTSEKMMVGRVGEQSECLERMCLSVGREAKWNARMHNKTGPLAWQMHKQRHWPCCPCCSRPSAKIVDGGDGTGNGPVIGRIEDPCTLCSMNNDIYDANGQQLYHVEATCCQLGWLCPCCADFRMEVQEHQKGGKQVGEITRTTLSCYELCCPGMRYGIKFPAHSSHEQRILLMGSQMMMDTVYLVAQQADSGMEKGGYG